MAAQSFGSSEHPAVVLVMGATAGWPEELCLGLAARNFFVIRYDHRDTGLSTTYEAGLPPPYTVEDMAADLLAVMTAYGIDRANIVGMSLGGLIAQITALSSPERVLTLTLIASEPLGWDGAPLPHIAPEFMEHFAAFDTIDWADHFQVREFLIRVEELCTGSAYPFDRTRAQSKVEAVLARSRSIANAFKHGAVQLREEWTGHFRAVSQPALVIHGDEDPILPVQNAEALAAGIRGARLWRLAGVGHELPVETIPELVSQLADHFSTADQRAS